MSIGTVVIWVIRPIAIGFPSARYIALGFFALFILIRCLLRSSLSMKSSVAFESMKVLLVMDALLPSSSPLAMMWSLSCSSGSL